MIVLNDGERLMERWQLRFSILRISIFFLLVFLSGGFAMDGYGYQGKLCE